MRTRQVFAKQVGGGKITDTESYEELANILNERKAQRKGGQNQRLAQLLGWLTEDGTIKANIPSNTDRDLSLYSQVRWKFLLEAPFKISNKCCNIIKKEPAHRYGKETGRKPMLATMADESRLRTQKWLDNGCNGFEMKSPVSTPMAFWKEQDVLKYIKDKNLPICSVYGEIVVDYEKEGQLNGQIDYFDLGLCQDNRKLKTTGCQRTGCAFCMFGAHCEKAGEGRFERMKVTHPQIYDFVMRSQDQGGLNYKEVIDWVNENNGKGIIIRY